MKPIDKTTTQAVLHCSTGTSKPKYHSGYLNGQKTTKLQRDTGADVSVIAERRLGKELVRSGVVNITTLHGTVTLPTTWVRLKVGGRKFYI